MLNNVKIINRLAFIIATCALLLAMCTFVGYGIKKWCNIDKITISGSNHYLPKDTLTQIITPYLDANFFTLNTEQLRYNLLRLPIIKQVSITREKLGVITIKLKEHTLLALINRVNSNYSAMLLTNDGYLITSDGLDQEQVKQLPILNISPHVVTNSNELNNLMTQYRQSSVLLANAHFAISHFDYLGSALSIMYISSNLFSSTQNAPITRLVLCTINHSLPNTIQQVITDLPILYRINPHLNYINTCYNNAVAIATNGTP